jgi:MATE family multidrug resistance protein
MLFDLLYWNFGFLRVGTGGLAAQAYGRGDRKECARILARALAMSISIAAVLLAIQWIYVKAAFLVVDCSPEVRNLAFQYFFVRIWAAPATLSLMALKGWFIGMQDSVSAMICDITVNVVNVLMSIFLALGLMIGNVSLIPSLGFTGIAAGTVAAQWTGLITALSIVFFRYRKNTISYLDRSDLKSVFNGTETRRFFSMNSNLFVRSLCFIAIYIGYTIISARYGDTLLAVSSILMKLLMIFSYFTDGFAYAGEALTGRYIGAGDGANVRATVKWTFVWSMSLALLFIGIYHFGGNVLLHAMTSDESVIDAARGYMPWLLLMPVVGCAAFTWDGIFIGATASREMRNSMLWSVAAFAVVYFSGVLILNPAQGAQYEKAAMHFLMAAYFAHLVARTVYMSLKARGVILFHIS